MPPKLKLHRHTDKPKTLPLLPVEERSSNDNIDPNSEVAKQFEVELCWCIQQLQSGLKGGKLNQKQVEEYTKALNTLMSNSAPVIKKRQVMRLSFGDYRAKMSNENKKFQSVINRVSVRSISPSARSIYIKKSSIAAQGASTSYKFNFQQLKHDDISDEVSGMKLDCDEAEKIKHELKPKEKFLFQPSDNNFKFNFSHN